MKKLIVLFACIGLSVSAFAADTPSPSLFNAGELGLTLSTGYDVGAANKVDGKTLFNAPYNFNLSAGAFYFPWRYLGVEANVPFYNTTDVSVDEVQVGLLFRLPLSKSIPVLKNISPYVGVGGVYNWQDEQDWAYIGKVGTEFRFNKKWGVFAEGQYRNYEFDNWGQGALSIQGGLKFVF